MHLSIKGIQTILGDFSTRLFNDEKTGGLGYFAITEDLIRKHYETQKRIDKLQVVKKFIWTSMVIGSGAIGWILKIIFDKI